MANDEEFAILFHELYPGLCRFLECLLGGHGRAAAQDLAQEAFLRLHRTGLQSLPGDEARFWLYRVARNLALNELKQRQVRHRLFNKVVDLFRARAPGPEEELERAERQEIVLEMLQSLPEHQRSALLLREQEGMNYQEIAGVLNVSESKVKVDIFRARATLRNRWAEHEAVSERAATLDKHLGSVCL